MDEATTTARAAVAGLKERIQSLDSDSLDLIFREARTFRGWQARDVSDETPRKAVELV